MGTLAVLQKQNWERLFFREKDPSFFLSFCMEQEEEPRRISPLSLDITSKLTLAIPHTVNSSQLQGIWYNRFQRDEVVAEWKTIKEKMSLLHVHCHISGDHLWLNLCAGLRHYIFSKELPVVLKAFARGDENLFNSYPELQKALVWVCFHSNISRFNKIESWGPLKNNWAAYGWPIGPHKELTPPICADKCACCFPAMSLIPWAQNLSPDAGGCST